MLICKSMYFTCLLQGSAHRNHVPEAAEVVPHAGNWSWKCRSYPGFEGMEGHAVQPRLGTVRKGSSLWDLKRGYWWKFNSVAAENLNTFELLAPWDYKKKIAAAVIGCHPEPWRQSVCTVEGKVRKVIQTLRITEYGKWIPNISLHYLNCLNLVLVCPDSGCVWFLPSLHSLKFS